jgi:hypothetical protein
MGIGFPDDILAAPFILGPITFAAPMMLWGALAAAAPIVIHLMMRSKPQRLPLPTIRFILKTHQQTQARHRLKHLLLLLLRMLLILLLVGALARPTVRTAVLAPTSRAPAEAVLCLDDSASMDYRSQGVSRFEQARDLAVRLLRDRGRFPSGSRAALLTGSVVSGARLSLDIDSIRSQAGLREVAQHDRGVGRMLERAYALLGEGTLATKEIYLFGDLTRQSWKDVPTGAFSAAKGVQVFCLDVGVDTSTNFALLDPAVPDRPVSAGAAVQIRVAVQAGQAGGRREVEAIVDTKTRWRREGISLQPRQVSQQAVSLSDLAPGLHQGELRLSPEDPLEIDNVRYLSLSVGDPPRVLLVGNPESEVAAVVTAMLAPAGLPADRRRIELSRMTPAELNRARALEPCSAVLLVDTASVAAAAFARLGEFVTAGGWLIVIPGPAMDPGGYQTGGGVLAALPAEVVSPAKPVHIAPLERAHPLLARFQDGSGLSLSEPAVLRYVRYGPPLEGGQSLAVLDAGPPAIVARPIGRGTSVVLAFSPTREWGDWAADAGPLLVLLNTMIADSFPRATGASNLRVGQEARLPVLPSRATSQPRDRRTATITSPTRRQSWPAAIESEDATVQAITDRCGHYRIRIDGDDGAAEVGYSVNTPAEESQLDRLSPVEIEARFAPGCVRVVKGLAELSPERSASDTSHDLTGWLALGLLALLLAEGLLSNRFYRQPEGEE